MNLQNVKNNEFLKTLCKEYKYELPNKFINSKEYYGKISNFKDAEYIYAVAYEMLIRTDEFNTLMDEYDIFIEESSEEITQEEFIKLNKLIEKMNELGLKKTSFLGFDSDTDYDNVFKKIKQYIEISNSPWNVRLLQKFRPEDGENIYYKVIKFYNNKEKLFKKETRYSNPELLKYTQEDIERLKKDLDSKDNESLEILNSFLEYTGIYCIDKDTNKEVFKLLGENIYLKELDKDFLTTLKNEENKDLLIQTKSEYAHYNTQFWYKYAINDIKHGLEKLLEYYIEANSIYNKDGSLVNLTISNMKKSVLENPSDFYIPCVNRSLDVENIKWKTKTTNKYFNSFYTRLRNDGHKIISRDNGHISITTVYNIDLVQIHKYISCYIIEDEFLNTLKYESLKNKYVETEPLFCRPRLMFDEARLTNIPINLNFSKEDLLIYIAQIKDEYDKSKNIVKSDIECYFNLPLESDRLKMPTNIKLLNKKTNVTRLIPSNRKEFKKSLATAFYIYDLYKFFLPIFSEQKSYLIEKAKDDEKKIKKIAKAKGLPIDKDKIQEIKNIKDYEIKNYHNNNLITQISYIVENQFIKTVKNQKASQEQIEDTVKYYLTVMKEFIHGVNEKGENNPLKIRYRATASKDKNPKYKNLIIGSSNIVKSNKNNLFDILIKKI